MQAWKDYQEQNKDRFLEEMLELLRIPSVSAKGEHKDDMRTCAELVQRRLLDAGCDKAEVMETKGHPVVYGEKITDPSKPTVLVYGHYAVQIPVCSCYFHLYIRQATHAHIQRRCVHAQ